MLSLLEDPGAKLRQGRYKRPRGVALGQLARGAVVEKHGGTVWFETEVERGYQILGPTPH
jgi:hypothetical protein